MYKFNVGRTSVMFYQQTSTSQPKPPPRTSSTTVVGLGRYLYQNKLNYNLYENSQFKIDKYVHIAIKWNICSNINKNKTNAIERYKPNKVQNQKIKLLRLTRILRALIWKIGIMWWHVWF